MVGQESHKVDGCLRTRWLRPDRMPKVWSIGWRAGEFPRLPRVGIYRGSKAGVSKGEDNLHLMQVSIEIRRVTPFLG